MLILSGYKWGIVGMFRGIHAVSVDAKGRVAVPARYRKVLQEEAASTVVLTIDTEDPCLLMYPFAEWQRIEIQVEALPSFNPATRRVKRLLMGHATELELDGQGRIVLPPLLREHAKIDQRLMWVGQGRKIELWDEAQWAIQCKAWVSEGSFQSTDLPSEMSEISI